MLRILTLFCLAPLAYSQTSGANDLTQMNLEDLLNLQVTSVSKKQQSLSKAGAAVFVVTQEDIRRSGVRTVPDALRMVPGVQVAQVDRNRWAISIRGFLETFGNKVLVLIDGRTVYRSSISGVFWDEIDVPVENIDRIEVVRGPGGTVWGANAVNGVINILTKKASDTQGVLVTTASGSESLSESMVQFGGKAGRTGAYRLFGKYNAINNTRGPGSQNALDGSNRFSGGFRSDWNLSSQDTLTVQGEFGRFRTGQRIDVPSTNPLVATDSVSDRIEFTGENIVARWTHAFQNGSEASVQFFDDRYERLDTGLRDSVNVADFDFQHHLSFKKRHDIVWGAAYRLVNSDSQPGPHLGFSPSEFTSNLFSTFIQDEFAVTPTISFTLGSKFEHNTLSGFEYEPGAQLVWEKSKRQTFWLSAARAIRQPARSDVNIFGDFKNVPLGEGAYGVVRLTGGNNRNTEQLRSAQVGHRAQWSDRLSVDSVFYISSYRNLQSVEPLPPYFTLQGGPHLILPATFDSFGKATSYGIEMSASWRVSHRWKLSPEFSALHLNDISTSPNGMVAIDPRQTARYLLGARSSFNVTRRLEWDASFSTVAAIVNTPSFTRVDSRLGWRLGEAAEVSVVGQNLLSARHFEFPTSGFVSHAPVQRTVFGRVQWRF